MKLHEVTGLKQGRHHWCGPSALSIISGKAYDVGLELLKEGREAGYAGAGPTVKGTGRGEMRRALSTLGYNMHAYLVPANGTTLAQWLRQRSPAEVREMFLLVAGNHWIVVMGRKACCGLVKTPVFISKMRKRRAIVTEVYLIKALPKEKVRKPRLKGLVRKPVRRTFAPEATAYRAFRKHMRAHGFTYGIEQDGPNIRYIATSAFGPFPKGWTTMHMGWLDTLERFETSLRHPEEVGDDGYFCL